MFIKKYIRKWYVTSCFETFTTLSSNFKKLPKNYNAYNARFLVLLMCNLIFLYFVLYIVQLNADRPNLYKPNQPLKILSAQDQQNYIKVSIRPFVEFCQVGNYYSSKTFLMKCYRIRHQNKLEWKITEKWIKLRIWTKCLFGIFDSV